MQQPIEFELAWAFAVSAAEQCRLNAPRDSGFENCARTVRDRFQGELTRRGLCFDFGRDDFVATARDVNGEVHAVYETDSQSNSVTIEVGGLKLVWRPTEAESEEPCWLAAAMITTIEGYHDRFE